jgi:hypothetical protein
MSSEFAHLYPIIFKINHPIKTDIRERVRSFEYINSNLVNINPEYHTKKPAAIIYKFRKTYYEMKCKNILRNILWNKIRRPKIEAKYSPQNLKIILQSMEDEENMDEFDKLITDW